MEAGVGGFVEVVETVDQDVLVEAVREGVKGLLGGDGESGTADLVVDQLGRGVQ